LDLKKKGDFLWDWGTSF